MSTIDSRIPTNMPTDTRDVNEGRTLDDHTSRLDGVAKLTGAARYGRDRYMDQQLQIAFVRCPYGAGTLTSSNVEAARQTPGVVEVELTGDTGRYHGHTVGYIVAENRNALARGMRALAPKWTIGEIQTSIKDGAPEPPSPSDAVKQLLEKSDFVLEAEYSTPIVTHSPLETHGGSVDYRGEEATLYSSTQGTSSAMDGMPEALGLPQSKVQVVCEYVGGGFGSKLNGAGKEGIKAGEIASKYRRPAYCFTDREEDHLDTGMRPSSRTWVKIGFNRDGTINGGQVHTWGGVGIARGGGGVRMPSGRYELGNIQKGRDGHTDVQINAGGPRPFRAPGFPQGAFAEELMLDEIATKAGVDPLALRMRVDPDVDRRTMYKVGSELIGWGDRKVTGSQEGVVRRGFGMGSTAWGRFPAYAAAEVAIFRDGSVEARTGTQDIGTGTRTIMGILAAEYLGVPLRHVSVAIGKSHLPEGPGSGGSMTAHNTSPAMMDAASKAKRKFLDAVASVLGENADGLDLHDGQVLHHGEPVMTFEEACSRMAGDSITARGENDPRNPGDARRYIGEGHSHGAQFVDLEVDTETGVISVNRVVAIQSCGKVLSRKTAESQIIGGVIQGLSYALFEEKILDRNTGAMVNANLEWYKVLGPGDMPHIEPVLFTKGQTGVRSLGEPPIIPTAGAVACALYNAIGTPVRHLPLRPDRVLDALG